MNSKDEDYNRLILEQYIYIIENLRGGKIFGEEIDFTNFSQVVVAAFYFGNAKRFFEHTAVSNLFDDKGTQDES